MACCSSVTVCLGSMAFVVEGYRSNRAVHSCTLGDTKVGGKKSRSLTTGISEGLKLGVYRRWACGADAVFGRTRATSCSSLTPPWNVNHDLGTAYIVLPI
jgi:hypothetical protein